MGVVVTSIQTGSQRDLAGRTLDGASTTGQGRDGGTMGLGSGVLAGGGGAAGCRRGPRD